MGVHTRYVQRTHCCESPVSWMDLGRYSSEERPAPSGAGPDIICRRSAFLPWTCDGFRSSVHSGVTGPQQNYGPATQIPPTGDDAISGAKQPGFCIEPHFGAFLGTPKTRKPPLSAFRRGFCQNNVRRDRDSNSGYPFGVYTLSRRAS